MAGHEEALRELLRSEMQGMLSTLSVRHAGAPFGSVVPYALWSTGEPLLWLSNLAAHTQNLRADARASLLISDSRSPEVQPPRATLVGRCVRLEDQDAARTVFAARFPDNAGLALPGFEGFVLSVDEARWIGGFAAAAWIDGARVRRS